jgi:hypothetical protein
MCLGSQSPRAGPPQTGGVATRQTRWFEYLWAHLGQKRLTSRDWRALEGLVREEATKRFKNAAPTAFQMLLAACDVREADPSLDSLLSRARHRAQARAGEDASATAAPTVALPSGRGRRVV